MLKIGANDWLEGPTNHGMWDSPNDYPLVNVYITMENDHHFQWANPLFLWPFSIANC